MNSPASSGVFRVRPARDKRLTSALHRRSRADQALKAGPVDGPAAKPSIGPSSAEGVAPCCIS